MQRRRRLLLLRLALSVAAWGRLEIAHAQVSLPEQPATAIGANNPPLSLAEAEALALRNQPSLRQSEANVDVDRARVEQARAPYFPQLAGTLQYQLTTGNFVPRPGAVLTNATPPPATSNQTYNFYTAGLVASQLIYDFGQTTGRWRAARATTDAARATADNDRANVLGEVRRAYFQLRALQDLAKVAAEALANQERHLEQIAGYVKAGLRPGIDQATAETDVENARVQLIKAESDYLAARAVLAQAIGTRGDQTYELTDSDFPPVAGEDSAPGALWESALRERPDLRALERQRLAQEAVVSASRGAYGPSLYANASATDAGRDLNDVVPNWSVGATLVWALSQGGLATGQLHEAQATLRGLAAQEDTLRLSVWVQVDQAALAVRAARSSRTAAEKAATSARNQLQLAEARYATGLGSAIELSDAQLALTQAEAQAVGTRYALAQSRAQLSTALGRP